MSLSRAFPTSAPVALAGATFRVHQLRLRDLARLEQWALDRLASPADALAGALALDDPTERRTALADAYDAIREAQGGMGSPAVDDALSSLPGCVMQLRMAIRKPRIRWSVALDAARRCTDAEWSRFTAIAWATDPLDQAAICLDRELGVTWPRPRDQTGSWGEAIWKVIELTGWSFDQAGRLTLSQWDLIRSGGKNLHPIAEPEEPPSGVGWSVFQRNVLAPRSRFWKAHSASRQPTNTTRPTPSSTTPTTGQTTQIPAPTNAASAADTFRPFMTDTSFDG